MIDSHTGGMGGGAMAPMMVLGLVGALLVLAVVAGLAFLLVRGLMTARHGHRGDPALDELRSAYARGELDQQEYEQRRCVLEEGCR